MSQSTHYRDYIIDDVLRAIPGITTKKLFSGWGLYFYKKIFGIIIDGELYFKTNNKNQKKFEHMGSHQFTYLREGKEVSLNYWTLPDEIFGDDERLTEWISLSARL